MKIAAVIPTYNEVESLQQLYAELMAVATEQSYDLEVLFVDDGSTDGSWDLIRRLSEADPRVRGIRFRRNFGKAAALRAGFEASNGDFIFTLDADLQDEIMGYFREAETDSIEGALEEFGSDVSEEDLRLVRLRFMSEVAN